VPRPERSQATSIQALDGDMQHAHAKRIMQQIVKVSYRL
jgi:hypothetical protein